jgi:hypothetical protein
MELPMQTLNDLSRSLIALEPASTLIVVIEMSLSSWLVAGIVPGIERQPLKKLAVDESGITEATASMAGGSGESRMRRERSPSSAVGSCSRCAPAGGRVAISAKLSVRNTLISLSPPIVTRRTCS